MNGPERSFREQLTERVVLFDGGTGTALYERGVFLNRSYEQLNLERPELVEEVHRAFLQAGADAVETNTFAASRPRLEQHGLDGMVREINRAGARAARRAVGRHAYVAGSVGPLGIRLEPWGPTSAEEAYALFREQMEGLIEGGVDLIVVETFTDIVEIQSAVRAARSLGDLPIVAMMTVDVEGRTPEGVPPEWFARKLVETEADVLGVNCSVGPAPMLSVIEAMAAVTDRPLAAMPNAGLPRDIDGRMHYLTSPAYLGSYAKRFAAAGARVVGGCCGVTPEHVRAMKEALDERSVRQAVPRITVEPPRSHPHAPVPREERTTLARKIASGRFVLLLELVPPRGWEVGSLREEVRAAAAAGFDGALVLSDPRFAGRVSSLAVARVVREACGSANDFEPVMQYAARDRLLPDVVSDLLGAQALGIGNLMLITGRAPRPGESPWSTPMFDIDAIGLVNVVNRLNHGFDVGDNPIGEPTSFFAGGLATVGAPLPEEELSRLAWKVDAGAEFVVTSPVFDVRALGKFLERADAVRVPVIATIEPLRSHRHAEHLAAEVPGVDLPAGILERMAAVPEQDQAAVGLEIARELIDEIRPLVEGILLSGPRAKDESSWALLENLFGSEVPVRREFRGRPGVMGSSESTRYEEERPPS